MFVSRRESVSELLDRIRTEIRERLAASRAAVQEYERLEAALGALGGPGAEAARAVTGRRVGDGAAGRGRPAQAAGRGRGPSAAARRAGGRAPRGANRAAVLRVVSERPGVTASELASAAGVKRSTLTGLLRTLVQRGELERSQLPGGQTGYSLAATTAEGAERTPAAPAAAAQEETAPSGTEASATDAESGSTSAAKPAPSGPVEGGAGSA
jgi:hypothetical protein